MNLQLFLKNTVLLIFVIVAQYFLFTYTNPSGLGQNIFKRKILENLDSWRNLSDTTEKFNEIENIRKTCDAQMLKRYSSDLDVFYFAKDKRFNQKLEHKNFLIDWNRKSIFYFNKYIDTNIWFQILTGIRNKTNSASGLKNLMAKNNEKFWGAAKTFDLILLGFVCTIKNKLIDQLTNK